MKTPVQLAALFFFTVALGAAVPSTPPAFQVRLVQETAATDTEQLRLPHLTDDGRRTFALVHVQKDPLMDHKSVASARVQKEANTDRPQIEITFTDKGQEIFKELTRANVGKRLALFVDGQLLCAPRIVSEIPKGKPILEGVFSEEEARTLAAKINAALKQ